MERIDDDVRLGHVHLHVSDLDRSVAFYEEVLGLRVTQRVGCAVAFLAAGGYHHHVALNATSSRGAAPAPPGHPGLYHAAFLFPSRPALARAIRRIMDTGIPLTGAIDHGVSEAVYLADPDCNGLELYVDRPPGTWPRDADGCLAMVNAPLDLQALLSEAEHEEPCTKPDDAGRRSAAPRQAVEACDPLDPMPTNQTPVPP